MDVEVDDLGEHLAENSDGSEDGFKEQKVIALNETVGNVRNAIIFVPVTGLQLIRIR